MFLLSVLKDGIGKYQLQKLLGFGITVPSMAEQKK